LTQDLKEPRLVADLLLTDSLFRTAGAAMEKECEAMEVEVNGWCGRHLCET